MDQKEKRHPVGRRFSENGMKAPILFDLRRLDALSQHGTVANLIGQQQDQPRIQQF